MTSRRIAAQPDVSAPRPPGGAGRYCTPRASLWTQRPAGRWHDRPTSPRCHAPRVLVPLEHLFLGRSGAPADRARDRAQRAAHRPRDEASGAVYAALRFAFGFMGVTPRAYSARNPTLRRVVFRLLVALPHSFPSTAKSVRARVSRLTPMSVVAQKARTVGRPPPDGSPQRCHDRPSICPTAKHFDDEAGPACLSRSLARSTAFVVDRHWFVRPRDRHAPRGDMASVGRAEQ